MLRLAGILQRIIRIIFTTEDISTGVGALFLVALFLIVLTAVVARQLGTSFVHAGELSIYLIIGIMYSSLARSLRAGEHIRVELVVTRLRTSQRLIMQSISDILSIPLCVIIAIAMWTILQSLYADGSVSASTLRFPLWITWAFAFMGICFFLLRFVIETVNSIRSVIGYYRRM